MLYVERPSFTTSIIKVIAILITIFFTQKALAWDCTVNKSSYQLTFPSITIQRDMTGNQPLTDWVSSGLTSIYSCDSAASFGGKNFNIQEVLQGVATGLTYTDGGISYNILKTSVDGLGVILRAQNQSTGSASSYYQFPLGLWTSPYYNAKFTAYFNIEAKLIKIGTISSGTLASTQVGLVRTVSSDYQNTYYYPVPIYIQGGSINVLACTVDNPVVNVNLGTFKKFKFNAVGYTTDPVDIPFTIDCQAGTKVNVTVSATADTTLGLDDLIKLSTTDGSATGVAVRITNKSNIEVKLNQSIAYGTVATAGAFDLGLQARYIQTNSEITAGTANTTATVTLTYQ